MSWLMKQSIRTKCLIACYAVAAAFSLAMLIAALVGGQGILLPLVLIVVLCAAVYPLAILFERTLSSSMGRDAHGRIPDRERRLYRPACGRRRHGRFQHRPGLQQHGRTAARHIARDVVCITRLVSDASRTIFERNQQLKTVMEQVTISAGELATGANQISEDVSRDEPSRSARLRHKVANSRGFDPANE